MNPKTILLIFISLFLFLSCSGKSKKGAFFNEKQQSQTVDTNKIYDMYEVDTPPVMPQ